MIDRAASAAALAKTLLMGLDRSSTQTTLPTASIEMILVALIDEVARGNKTAGLVGDAQARAVMAAQAERQG